MRLPAHFRASLERDGSEIRLGVELRRAWKEVKAAPRSLLVAKTVVRKGEKGFGLGLGGFSV